MTTATELPPDPRPAAPVDAVTGHPVAVMVQRLSDRLDQVVAVAPVWSMTPTEQTTTLATLSKVTAQLDALRLLVLVEADRSGATTQTGTHAGAATAADWMAAEQQQRRSTARAELKLADTLCRYRHLETGMLTGAVSLDQAHVIKRALERLPQTGPFALTWDQVETAEQHLVALCADFDPTRLEILGQKIFHVIAPETADAAEEALLAAQEDRAHRRTSLRTWRDGEGLTHGRFAIPDLHGAMLRKAIDALASPLRPQPGPEEDQTDGEADAAQVPVPGEQRRGEALCELIERMAAADLPTTAGGDATVVVTMTTAQLRDDLHHTGVATLDTGIPVTAGEARRLACHHRILPAVLAGASQVLDLGHSARLFSKAQRLALHLRDGGCTTDGCDTPPAMCHAHHDRPWSEHGPTDLANARLLCARDHRRIHDPRYDHDIGPDNQVRFHHRE